MRSFSFILFGSALMAWIAMPDSITAAMLPDAKPKEWPADPTKHRVTIRRESTDEKQAALIAAAEAAQPSKEVLRDAAGGPDREGPAGAAPPNEAPQPAGEKIWWYQEELGIRIPCAITADAVDYYSGLVEKYGKEVLNRYMQPSSSLEYQAAVKFHDEFKIDQKTFEDVHVVTLKLTFSQDFVATQTEGMKFAKERVVVFDTNGKVLHISGDGPTEVMILAI